MLSKVVSSTIFKVFGMTPPGIEPMSLGPLANTLPTIPKVYKRGKGSQEIVKGRNKEGNRYSLSDGGRGEFGF